MDHHHYWCYRYTDSMNMRDWRGRLIDRKNKRVYQLYHRLRRIKKEVRKIYHADLFCYAYYKPERNMDMHEFLKLRDEANKLFNIIYNKEYNRCVKYVKGGGRFFYTPMMKKERRKALRKFRQNPLGYYQKIYEEEAAFLVPRKDGMTTLF